MAVPPFDILAATRSLESSGIPRAQAESIVGTVQQSSAAWAANLATKDDLNALRAATEASIDRLRAEMKADLAKMQAELFRALWTQSLGMATITLTGVGVLLALFRIF